jgi:hypothetical protein
LMTAVCWRVNRCRAVKHQAALLLRRLGGHKPIRKDTWRLGLAKTKDVRA